MEPRARRRSPVGGRAIGTIGAMVTNHVPRAMRPKECPVHVPWGGGSSLLL